MDTGDGTSYVDLAPSAATGPGASRVPTQRAERPEIWINDTNQRTGMETYKVVAGSEPAVSLDGKKLAYVGANGQIFVTEPQYRGTTERADHVRRQPSRRTSPGTRMAGTSPIGRRTRSSPSALRRATGQTQPRNCRPQRGTPAYLAGAQNTVNRLSAADPIALSIGISQARWPTAKEFAFGQGYPGAFGATVTVEAAAMGAVGASTYPGPLLLTSGASLDPRTKAELQRIFGKVFPDSMLPEITIVGNEVSAGAEQELKDMGYHVTRKSGQPPPGVPNGVCGSQGGAGLLNRTVVVVDISSTTDESLAASLARSWQAPIVRVSGGALTDDQAQLPGPEFRIAGDGLHRRRSIWRNSSGTQSVARSASRRALTRPRRPCTPRARR